jgi:hypothetical protein
VVEGTLTSKAPRYSVILELDRKIRDMELPAYAQGEAPKNAGLAETMSHFMPHNYRDLSKAFFAFTSFSRRLMRFGNSSALRSPMFLCSCDLDLSCRSHQESLRAFVFGGLS